MLHLFKLETAINHYQYVILFNILTLCVLAAETHVMTLPLGFFSVVELIGTDYLNYVLRLYILPELLNNHDTESQNKNGMTSSSDIIALATRQQ